VFVLNQQNFHKFFTLYFIVFGIIISCFSVIVAYTFEIKDIEIDLNRKAKEIFQIKNETILKPTFENIDNIAKSLAYDNLTKKFLIERNSLNKENLNNIFLAVANSNSIIMQARLIDKSGQELVRVDRNKENQQAFIVGEKDLQNKYHRDYFQSISKLNEKEIWHSKLDLNIEHGKIEIPYRPTIRVGIALFENNQFSAMVVINLLTNNLFKSLASSSIFDCYIIDENKNYILHPNQEFAFNKYKNIARDISIDFPDGLNNGIFTFSLKDSLKNEDNAILILKTKKDYKKELLKERTNVAVIVFLLTVALSFIMAIFVSKTPRILQEKLLKANKKLNEFTLIIDKYVITVTTKIDSTIVEASKAFEQISGYSKEELIGKKISIISNPKQDKMIIKELWKTILDKKIWEGEILNKSKDGKDYWLNQYIIPKKNAKNDSIEQFISVGVDITAKKELEKFASIDKLTGIYNRRMLDTFLQKEIEVAKRHKDNLSLIIIDIDFFKLVNDTYGHLVGDNVLKQLSKIISENIRISDIFGRYGGEEFLIICTKTSEDSAFILAEKLRKEIENFRFEKVGYKTISLGISSLKKDDNIELLFKKADEALYEAKKSGRNKSIIYR
jgi:diguanylate cyclase (GGDEF)-like protein/PAS domain S-box-containing protein